MSDAIQPIIPTTDYSLLIPEHFIPKLLWAISQEDCGPWGSTWTSWEIEQLESIIKTQLLDQGEPKCLNRNSVLISHLLN